MTESPVSVLCSAEGQILGVTPDGADQRLMVESRPAPSRATYAGSLIGLSSPGSSDVASLCGALGKVIRVTRATFSGTQELSSKKVVLLVKRITASVGGQTVDAVAAQYDSVDPAPTAHMVGYSQSPMQLGDTGGMLGGRRVTIGITTDPPAQPPPGQAITITATNSPVSTEIIYGTGGGIDVLSFIFGSAQAQFPVLRGAGESLCFNMDGSETNLPDFNIGFEWTEEEA